MNVSVIFFGGFALFINKYIIDSQPWPLPYQYNGTAQVYNAVFSWQRKALRPRGLFVSFNLWHKQLTTLWATYIFVLMHSGIVIGYQLLCDAHTVLEPHRETAAFSFLLTIVLFHFFFLCVCHF